MIKFTIQSIHVACVREAEHTEKILGDLKHFQSRKEVARASYSLIIRE